MNMDAIHARADAALAANRRAESIATRLSSALFLLGVALIAGGVFMKDAIVSSPTILVQACLYWPIREILRIRRDNIALQAFPVLIDQLPPREAATELKKLLAHLRGEK